MKEKNSLILGLLLVLVSGLIYPARGSGVTIDIDGEFSDWDGIAPVFIDEETHPEYWLDIQQGFVAANDTTLYIRLDYASPLDYWDSLLGNITIRTPTNNVYILMYQIIYDVQPFWSFSAIFPGMNLSSYLNDGESLVYVDYQNSVAIDLSTNRTVEYYFLLEDLGLQLTDTIDIAFWHYENESAGQYSALLHRLAGIAYQISLDTTSTSSSSHASTTTTTTEISNLDTTSQHSITDTIPLDIIGVMGVPIIFLISRKRKGGF